MHLHALSFLLMPLVMLACANQAFAEVTTPASNLSGVKQLQERIDVSLNLKGADEFGVEANEVIKIVRSTLNSCGISTASEGYEIPSVHVEITGESTGGGGAKFNVEIAIHALLPSPFADERSIDAIIWRYSASGDHLMRYDPASKGMVSPSGTINSRVYDAVHAVTSRLVTDAKIAGACE